MEGQIECRWLWACLRRDNIEDEEIMTVPLRKGATPPQPNWPGIETERLILRQWRASDVAANTAMLSDPDSGRFITPDRKPVTEPMAGWRNSAIMAGHWVLHGFGMFVVEEKASSKFVGRVGPFYPPFWPDFEVGWGIAKEVRGKGYAVEAARAAINWVFATFELDHVIHCIDRENVASQAVARKLGARHEGEGMLLAHAIDIWVTRLATWTC
jgi:RimJ/RimL family protein N-acetyltransferase